MPKTRGKSPKKASVAAVPIQSFDNDGENESYGEERETPEVSVEERLTRLEDSVKESLSQQMQTLKSLIQDSFSSITLPHKNNDNETSQTHDGQGTTLSMESSQDDTLSVQGFGAIKKENVKAHEEWMKRMLNSPKTMFPDCWNGDAATYTQHIRSVARQVHAHYCTVNSNMKVDDHLLLLRKCTLGKGPTNNERNGMYHHIWQHTISADKYNKMHNACTPTKGLGEVLEHRMKRELIKLSTGALAAVHNHQWTPDVDATQWVENLTITSGLLMLTQPNG
jgi:hypothetical protein